MSAQEPLRFRDDPSAPEGLRSLVDSARQAEPSRGAAERIAAGVQAHIGSPSGGEAASGPGSTGTGTPGAASGSAGGTAGATVGGATAARVGGLLLAATTLIGGGVWWANQPSPSSTPGQAPGSEALARVDTERGSMPAGSTEPPTKATPGTTESSDAATATGTSADAGDTKDPTPEARGETEADAPHAAPTRRQAEAPGEPSARGRTPKRRGARPEARHATRERHEAPPEPSAAPAAEPARPSPEPSQRRESEASGPSEGQLLRRAQDALPAQPRQALQLVAEHARRFPEGHLVQEREVLAVQALVELGRVERARSRAQRFLDDHPNTAHRTRLEALFEDEGGIHPDR